MLLASRIAFHLYISTDSFQVDKPFPPQTLYQFFDFAFEGKLPAGRRTSLPLITEDEVSLLVVPYSMWAPEPYNQLPSSVMESVLAVINDKGLQAVWPRKAHALKSRLWGGMTPMSGNRWQEKRLDDPKNNRQAVEFMVQLLLVFTLLGNETVQTNIRKGFNMISAEMAKFQSAINALRAERNATPLNMTGLWVEFIESVFAVMTTRTHSWIIARCDELQRRCRAEYEATADDGSSAAFAAGKFFINITQDLGKVVSRADFSIAMPMDGFDDYQAPDSNMPASMEDRETLYYALVDSMPWASIKKLVDASTGGEPGSGEYGFRNRQACLEVYNEGREARQQIRVQIRGKPSSVGEEHWISILKSRTDWALRHGSSSSQDWGFVAYRLSYKESQEEWEQFLTKLNADFKRSGEWIDGWDDIRNAAKLQWLDGKELGIPENDVAAAKRWELPSLQIRLLTATDTSKDSEHPLIFYRGCGRSSSSRWTLNRCYPTAGLKSSRIRSPTVTLAATCDSSIPRLMQLTRNSSERRRPATRGR